MLNLHLIHEQIIRHEMRQLVFAFRFAQFQKHEFFFGIAEQADKMKRRHLRKFNSLGVNNVSQWYSDF